MSLIMDGPMLAAVEAIVAGEFIYTLVDRALIRRL